MGKKSPKIRFKEDKHIPLDEMNQFLYSQYGKEIDWDNFDDEWPDDYEVYLKKYGSSKKEQDKLSRSEFYRLLEKYEKLRKQAEKKKSCPGIRSEMEKIIERCLLG